MTRRLFIAAVAVVLAFLPSCDVAGNAEEGGHAAGTDETAATAQPDTPTNRVDIPPTVRRNLGITFANVEVRRVAQTLRVPGSFESTPRARHEYRVGLPGRVQLYVDQYQRVEEGELLYRFQSPAWPELLHEIILGEQAIDSADAEIEVAAAKLEEAERRVEIARERIDALAQADFKRADLETEAAELEASLRRLKAELGLAETRRANAERTREHALHRASTAGGIPEAELEADVVVDGESVPAYHTVDWIEVRATGAGVVETLAVTEGAYVEPPAMVLSVVDPDRVRFRALALQTDLAKIAGSDAARIVPPRSPGLELEPGVDATMTISLEAHPQERTLTLLASPDGRAEWIRPGVSGFLEIVVASSDGPVLAVPTSAVVQDGLVHVLFRRDPADPNKAIRVEADLGTSDGRWIALQSGVVRGDEVVLAGAYELKLATQQRGPQPGGHFHADGSFHDNH